MFEIDAPTVLSPEDLDARLAAGWFRSGPMMVRSDLLCLDHRVRGLVNLRLPLDDHRHRRSHRRTLRRAREHFRCEIGEARVDAERRRLYREMKPRFMSFVSSELEPLVLGRGPHPFDSYECAVYEDDRLVAVSYFDLGREGMVSQLGLYDPAYRRFGLGTYTMLEEIEFGIERGMRFYYPGYVVPGVPAFDYKTRLGDVQYLDGSGRWRRRARPPRRAAAAERHDTRLRALRGALDAAALAYETRLYPGFPLAKLDPQGEHPPHYLRGLVVVRLDAAPDEGGPLVIEYLHDRDEFVLSRIGVDHEIDLLEGMDPVDHFPDVYDFRALFYREILIATDRPKEIVRAAAARLPG